MTLAVNCRQGVHEDALLHPSVEFSRPIRGPPDPGAPSLASGRLCLAPGTGEAFLGFGRPGNKNPARGSGGQRSAGQPRGIIDLSKSLVQALTEATFVVPPPSKEREDKGATLSNETVSSSSDCFCSIKLSIIVLI